MKRGRKNLVFFIAIIIFILIIGLVVFIWQNNFFGITGKIVWFIPSSSYAPESVFLNSNFEMRCDFNEADLPCINAKHGEESCSFIRFDGTVGVFNCNATEVGEINNYCDLFMYPLDYRCTKDEVNEINSTNVLIPADLIDFYVPENVLLGDSFEIKCDFGIPWLNCVIARHGNNNCVYMGYNGTKSFWECTATNEGTIKNYCNLFDNEEDIRCKEETNEIDSIEITTSCSDECISGNKRCNSNNVETCGNYDSDDCLEWGNSNACPIGKICENGICYDEKELLAYYIFEGNAKDLSENNNHGSTHGPSPTTGKTGQAYSFDGVDDYINFGNYVGFNSSGKGYSISIWVKRNETSSNGKIPICKYDGNKKGFLIQTQSNGKMTGYFGNGILWQSIDFGNINNLGKWYHLVMITNLTTISSYTNGVKIDSKSLRGFLIPSDDLRVGSDSSGSGNSFFNGKVDEIRIFNYALEESEIIELSGGCTKDLDCDDGNVCTDDNCNLATNECVYFFNTNECETTNLCTENDGRCSNGICIETPINCDDGRECTTDSCILSSGNCQHDTDGCSCNNNSACSDNNDCTNNYCNLTIEKCYKTFNNLGCDDKNSSTLNDICTNGVCKGENICNSNSICEFTRGENCSNCMDCGTCFTTSTEPSVSSDSDYITPSIDSSVPQPIQSDDSEEIEAEETLSKIDASKITKYLLIPTIVLVLIVLILIVLVKIIRIERKKREVKAQKNRMSVNRRGN